MSRVHDALRRAEQAGYAGSAGGPANGRDRIRGAAVQRLLGSGANLAGLLELVEEIPFRTATGFPADRRLPAARSAHGGVPHAAHAAQSHEEPAADSHGGGHQPIAGRRQVALGGESGAGRGAPGRQHHAAGGFRFPPPDRAHPVRDRPQPGHHRLPAGQSSAAPGDASRIAGTNLYIMPAGRGGDQSAGTAEPARSEAAAGPAAVAVPLDHSGQPAAAVRRRRESAVARCATARCWWCASATPPSIR